MAIPLPLQLKNLSDLPPSVGVLWGILCSNWNNFTSTLDVHHSKAQSTQYLEVHILLRYSLFVVSKLNWVFNFFMSLSRINICNCYHYALFLFCVELRFLRSTYIYILEKLGTSHLGRLYLGHTFPSPTLSPKYWYFTKFSSKYSHNFQKGEVFCESQPTRLVQKLL